MKLYDEFFYIMLNIFYLFHASLKSGCLCLDVFDAVELCLMNFTFKSY